MSDNALGYYILTLWASASGANAADVRANFSKMYGVETITNIGKSSRGLNYGSLQSFFRDLVDNGASTDSPSLGDINNGIITVGGDGVSFFEAASGAISDTTKAVGDVAGEVFSLSKILLVAVIVGGVVYIGWSTGALRARK